MLSTIREKTQGIIATFIIVLIAIPFALWGVNSYFNDGGQIIVAKVGGTEITQNDYRRQLEGLRGRFDPKLLDSPHFKQTILGSMIDRTMMVRHAEDKGYRVNNAQLADAIRQQKSFQRDGKFDQTLYQALLRQEGMSPQQFESRLRDQNLITQLESGISDSYIVTQSEISSLAHLLGQEREVAYAVIGIDKLVSKTSVTEKDVEQYYASHPNLYLIPEQVRIDYVQLSAGALNKNHQPTEDELKRAYTEEAARYVVPEKRRASHILIALPAQATDAAVKEAQVKIQDIAKQATAGTSFASLAKKYSTDPVTAQQGGDLGEVRRGVLPKELESAVYALKPNEVSQPVRTTYGFHIVKLTSLTPEKRKSFADAHKELIIAAKRRFGEERFFDLSEKFRNIVYEQPDSLAPAAKALGLEIQKSDWFAQTGGVAGITANPKIVQAAFEPNVLSQVRNSDAIELSADTIVALRVAERKPAGRQPLSAVRSQIEKTLKQERAVQQARQLSEAVLPELRAGSSLESLAKKRGFTYHASKPITRRQSGGIDAPIVASAFRLARPEGGKPVYGTVDLGAKGFAVLALHKVHDASGQPTDALKQEAISKLSRHRGDDYVSLYRAALRQKTEVKTYPDKL